MPPLAVAAAGAAAVGGAAVAAGGLTAAFAAGGLTGFVASTGASLLLSGAASALAPSPSVEVQDNTVTVREPARARDLVYGRTRKGGTIVFIESTDRDDRNLHLVIVFATHRVHKIGEIYFNGELAFDADGNAQDNFSGRAWVEKRLGDADQSAFVIDGVPEWTSDHRLLGCAAIYLRLRFDRDVYPSGIPDVTAYIEGKNDILDPRTDERGYTENPALCLADYMSNPTWGLGAIIGEDIDEDDLIEAANVCDEAVPLALVDNDDPEGPTLIARAFKSGLFFAPLDLVSAQYQSLIRTVVGGSWALLQRTSAVQDFKDAFDEFGAGPEGGGLEPRYTCNGVINLKEQPKPIIEKMLTAMAGRCAWRGGSWHIHAGAYREPTASLGENDCRSGGMKLSTRVSMSENFNGVRGTFVSPENDWQPDDYPAYKSDTYIAEDRGEQRWHDLPLPFTISPSTAQRIAKIELERARRQMTVEMQGKLSAWRAMSGENVELTYSRWGFEDKPFEVRASTLSLNGEGEDAALGADLVLRETSPLVFDWDASEEDIYEAAPRSNLPGAGDIEPPGVPLVSEALFVTRDGTGVKAKASLDWSEAESSFVDRYEVQARRFQDLDGTPTGDEYLDYGVTQQTFFEVRDIEPGFWQFRVRSVSLLGKRSEWRIRQQEILGITAPPQQLKGLSLQAAGGVAIIKWRQSPDLDVRIGGRIVIRHSRQEQPSWANSVSMDEVAGADGVAVVALKRGTYILRAQDNSGNLGPPAFVETRGAQALPFANIETLIEDPAFSGDKTNCEVDSGSLIISDLEVGEAKYVFDAGLDFGSIKTVRLRSDIDVTALNLAQGIDDRTPKIDTWADFDDTDGAEVDVVVEARTTDDDPSGSPDWSAWSRLDSAEIEARGVQCRALLTTQTDAYNVLLTRLRVDADEVV